jgi:hypothetical protein
MKRGMNPGRWAVKYRVVKYRAVKYRAVRSGSVTGDLASIDVQDLPGYERR